MILFIKLHNPQHKAACVCLSFAELDIGQDFKLDLHLETELANRKGTTCVTVPSLCCEKSCIVTGNLLASMPNTTHQGYSHKPSLIHFGAPPSNLVIKAWSSLS